MGLGEKLELNLNRGQFEMSYAALFSHQDKVLLLMRNEFIMK